jgi:hypothetical protein
MINIIFFVASLLLLFFIFQLHSLIWFLVYFGFSFFVSNLLWGMFRGLAYVV